MRGGELGVVMTGGGCRWGAVVGKILKGGTVVALGGCIDLVVSQFHALTSFPPASWKYLETQVCVQTGAVLAISASFGLSFSQS